MKTMLLILMALFTSCAVLTAQEANSGSKRATDQKAQKSNQKSAGTSSQSPELQDAIATAPAASSSPSLLKDAGPERIEDATRKAAHDLASAGQTGKEAKAGTAARNSERSGKDAAASTPPEIGEFQPAPAGTSRTSANPVVQRESSTGKRIHGEISGASSNLGRAGSESVGATSKSGKTSVYVQSDQAASTPAPH